MIGLVQHPRVRAFQLRVGAQAAVAPLEVLLESVEVNITGRRYIRVGAFEVVGLGIGEHGLHCAFRRRGRRGRASVYRTRRNQCHGQDGEQEWQSKFHYLASLRIGSWVEITGNSMCSNLRRRYGNNTTTNRARMLLPIGSVPHKNPSNALGGVP